MNNTTEIALVLDQSGSMESIKTGTLEGVNAFIDQQKKENSSYPVRFTLTLFSTETETRYDSVPVADIPSLEDSTYRPSGGTALLDAIGITIDRLGKRLSKTPEADRPGKVIVGIMTDGEENSSRDFTWEQIREKIHHQTEVYRWEFLFLGANQDAIATAARINIVSENSALFFQRDGSSKSALRAMSASVRHSKTGRPNWSKKALSELVAEEEAKSE